MSDTTEVEDLTPAPLKFSVEIARTLSDGNYGSTQAKLYLQGEYAADANETQIAEAAGRLFMAAKVAVFDELGITYHVDTETMIVHEDAAPVTVARVAQALGGTTAPAAGAETSGIAIKNAKDLRDKGVAFEPLPEWAVQQINAAGVKVVFDNRTTRTGNQPWFKEAIARGALAVDGSSNAAAFWPPKD